jgi:hypothetical protein
MGVRARPTVLSQKLAQFSKSASIIQAALSVVLLSIVVDILSRKFRGGTLATLDFRESALHAE